MPAASGRKYLINVLAIRQRVVVCCISGYCNWHAVTEHVIFVILALPRQAHAIVVSKRGQRNRVTRLVDYLNV